MDSISESEECALSGGKESGVSWRLLGKSIGLGRMQLLVLPAGDPLGLESRSLRPGSSLPAPHAFLLNASLIETPLQSWPCHKVWPDGRCTTGMMAPLVCSQSPGCRHAIQLL